MARVIPNQNTWIGFTATAPASLAAPSTAEINGCTNLTPWVVSLTASSQGNLLPTPAFDSLFETTIPGTVQGSFTMDCYRDDSADTAWNALPRATTGFIIISRFGGTGGSAKPTTGNKVEVWPVRVSSRSMQAATSNQVQIFQVACGVSITPDENATVGA
jgi:hypothetical protein